MTTDSPHIQRLKQSGYRLTQARLTVLAVLEAEHGHITSADVLEKVEGINPAIGRASVFRTLDLFTQPGHHPPDLHRHQPDAHLRHDARRASSSRHLHGVQTLLRV